MNHCSNKLSVERHPAFAYFACFSNKVFSSAQDAYSLHQRTAGKFTTEVALILIASTHKSVSVVVDVLMSLVFKTVTKLDKDAKNLNLRRRNTSRYRPDQPINKVN